jgi:hypothetical protein
MKMYTVANWLEVFSPLLHPHDAQPALFFHQPPDAALAAAFGDRVQPCPAGTVLTF